MGGTPSYSYKWYENGNLTATTTSPNFTFTPPSITRYYVLLVVITDAVKVNATSNVAIVNGHDVAATAIIPVDTAVKEAPKTIFAKGYPIRINVTVADVGYYPETFTVIAYVNGTILASQSVTLPSGGKTAIILAGNTTNLAYGHYIVSAEAVPVAGEVDTANNYITYSTRITLTLPGDLNGDGVVNGLDLHILAQYWLETVPPGLANADANGDGVINGLELHLLAINWLKSVVL
jgi:hypothetical protein